MQSEGTDESEEKDEVLSDEESYGSEEAKKEELLKLKGPSVHFCKQRTGVSAESYGEWN